MGIPQMGQRADPIGPALLLRKEIDRQRGEDASGACPAVFGLRSSYWVSITFARSQPPQRKARRTQRLMAWIHGPWVGSKSFLRAIAMGLYMFCLIQEDGRSPAGSRASAVLLGVYNFPRRRSIAAIG